MTLWRQIMKPQTLRADQEMAFFAEQVKCFFLLLLCYAQAAWH